MVENYSTHPFEDMRIVKGVIVDTKAIYVPDDPRETSQLLTTECEPIAAVSFNEIMSTYPGFLISLGVGRLTAHLEAQRIRQDFLAKDPYERSEMLETLGTIDNARRELKHKINVGFNPSLETPNAQNYSPTPMEAGTIYNVSEAAGD